MVQAIPVGDSTLRAMTNDGAFRVVIAQTTGAVRAAAQAQGASGTDALLLAEVITAAALVRETMAPSHRVQVILQGTAGTGSVVADSQPNGDLRGLLRRPAGGGSVALGPGALLQVMRTLPGGNVHTGVVEAALDGGISGAVMAYMQSSEQVVSVVSVGTRLDGGEIAACGGYVVQLLPEVHEGVLAIMTERLDDFPNMDSVLGGPFATPDALLDELLYGMPFTRLDSGSLRFGCQCSQVRVLTSLGTLAKSEIEDLMKDGVPLEIQCDYCGSNYRVEPEQLRGLLDGA